MLIGFRFKNFRSYRNEQVFSFASSSDRTHEHSNCVRTGVKSVPQISKTSAVFGPNASGKSNFITALETLRNLVLNSTAYSAQQFSEQHTPYQFCPDVREPTNFEVNVLLDGVRYRYCVSHDSQRVIHEKLCVYQTGKAQRWFERHYDVSKNVESWAPFSPAFHGPREMWRKATRPAALFLSTGAQLNSVQLQPLFEWFEHRLDFMFPSKSDGLARAAPRLLEEGFKTKILRLLQSVDIKVDDVRIPRHAGKPATSDSGQAATPSRRTEKTDKIEVEFLHGYQGSTPVWTRFDHESAGAHRLFGLFSPLLTALDQDKLLVVDDFDLHLHPLVARQVIKLVNDPSTCQAQLLLVSHNTALMDLSIFRRDEIWLTEIAEDRSSSLYPVSRASPRRHEQIARGYLKGRYGAVPHIKCVQSLMEAPNLVI